MRTENETAVPSFRVQSTNQHQDTMSLQDVDLGLLHDDQADFYYQDDDKQVPHIERTLTEESAGKFYRFSLFVVSLYFFYFFLFCKIYYMPSDTGYFQSTLNQPSPACSLQHSDNDDLYQQIMQEVMLNAPSLLALDSEYSFRKEDSLDVTVNESFMLNRAHRRSYMLAIRRESSRGNE